MNKLTLLRKRLVILLLVFCFIIGMFPSVCQTKVVYADKKKIGVLVLTDSTNFYSTNFHTSADAESTILSIQTRSNAQYYMPALNNYKTALKALKKECSKVDVIFAPIMSTVLSTGKISYIRKDSQAWLEATSSLIKDLGWDKDKKIKIFVLGAEPYYSSEVKFNGMTSPDQKDNRKKASDINSAVSKQYKNIATFIQPTSAMDGDQTKRAQSISNLLNKKDDKLKNNFGPDIEASTESKTDNDGTKYENTEDLLKELGVDAKYKENIEKYAQYIIGEGYSEAATAGILANMRAESGFNPLSSESGKSGAGGLFGYDPITNFSNSKFNRNCGDDKGTAGGQSVCSEGKCQIYYTLDALKKAIDSYSNNIKSANEFFAKATDEDKKADKYTDWGKKVKFPDNIDYVKNLDEFKKVKDPVSAAAIFAICFERCAGIFEPCHIETSNAGYDYHASHPTYPEKTWHDFMLNVFNVNSGRLSYAEPIYEWLTGESFKNTDTSGAQEMAKEAAKKGYLTEEELSAWTKIINEKFINYKDITRDSLTQSELSSLAQWENNVGYDSASNHGIFKLFRIAFMIMAIMMMIWAVVMYCAYWWDRTTPFDLGVSALSLVTFHKLETAPTEEECNYTVKGFFKEHKDGAKFINHRYMLFVCLILIIFSVLILTGFIYKILLAVVSFVSRIFG